LAALVLLSAVWHRAVRLTTKRIEGAIPVSMTEIQADKDQLRAEFAMSTRRLETSVEQLKFKTTEQLAEIGRKNETVRLLKAEVEEKTAAVTALEAHERTSRDRLRSTEEELSLKSKALHDAETELAAKAGELAKFARSIADKTSEADSQRVENVALETQCETLKGRIGDLEREVAATEERLVEERGQADKTSRALAEEREKVEDLTRRLAEMDARLAETKAQALAMARAEVEKNRAEILDFQQDAEIAVRSFTATVENLKAEKSMLEGSLMQVRDDRERLQQEVAALKHEAEAAWSNERVESALLRERINDVAAEVARLAANLEGTGSPIERILSEAPPPAPRQNGPRRSSGAASADPHESERPLSLAERIRALQVRSGRR
jgi:DNA repair exonuclease SbcCD ATPase subunit